MDWPCGRAHLSQAALPGGLGVDMRAGYSADRRSLDFHLRSPAEDGNTISCVGWATCVTEIGTSGQGELSGFPRLSFQLDGACRSPELMRSAGQAPVAVGKLALAAKPTETAAFSMLLVAENVKFGRIDELPVPKGKQRPHLVAQVISRGCCLITANRVWLGARHCRGRRTTPPKHQSLAAAAFQILTTQIQKNHPTASHGFRPCPALGSKKTTLPCLFLISILVSKL